MQTTETLCGLPRIAVVDDRPGRVNLALRALAGARFRARAFTSPREALDVLSTVRFDAVVTDHRMGDVDATTMCAQLRERLGRSAPPFVLITRSVHDVAIRDRDLFATILEKPVSPAGLVISLERVVQVRARLA